jgi:flagellar biogenesis protein FliO
MNALLLALALFAAPTGPASPDASPVPALTLARGSSPAPEASAAGAAAAPAAPAPAGVPAGVASAAPAGLPSGLGSTAPAGTPGGIAAPAPIAAALDAAIRAEAPVEPRTPFAPSTPPLVSALPAVSALAALAAVALLLSRRRGRSSGRLVEVVETASLGPKRQLVVARMGEQLLLLASSESGITLLSSQPAPQEAEAGAPVLAAPAEAADGSAAALEPLPGDALATPAAVDEPPSASVASLWERLRTRGRPAEPSFESLLQETAEDLELRRKLARGLAGKVA